MKASERKKLKEIKEKNKEKIQKQKDALLQLKSLHHQGKNTFNNQEIIDLYNQGFSVFEISVKCNRTVATIISVLEKEGIKVKINKWWNKPFMDEEVIKLFKSGKNHNEIAYELNTLPLTVMTIIKKQGLIQRNLKYGNKSFNGYKEKEMYRKEVKKQVETMYHQGKTKQEIQDHFSLTSRQVSHYLTRSGIQNQDYSIGKEKFNTQKERNLYRKNVKKQVEAMYRHGKTKQEIQDHFGLTHSQVSNCLTRAGIDHKDS